MTKNILVIDDEAAVRNSFTLALENTGYTVDTAPNGQKGLECFMGKKYHLVYLDLKMPVMGGVETLTKSRISWSGPKAGPVI